MWSLARRPRWIGALLFALALAATFALLSQWQLSRAVSTGTVVSYPTEKVVELDVVAKPQQTMTARASEQMVSVTGVWVPGDDVLVSQRVNHSTTGWWVVGHFSAELDSGLRATLPVALGWAPNKADAAAALKRIDSSATAPVSITGRYTPSEDPSNGNPETGAITTVGTGDLINRWATTDGAGAYAGYLIAEVPTGGLTAIYSPKPSTDVEVNWLNIFYAAEWVVFAGFAIFLWYRLVKDAWEREQDEAAEAAEAAASQAAPDPAEVH